MKLLLSLLCSILAFGFNGLCQKAKYLQGYYIKSNGDTTHGFIMPNFNNGEPVFKFKVTDAAVDFSKISIETCKRVIVGKDTYVSWYGPRGMTYIDKFEFTSK